MLNAICSCSFDIESTTLYIPCLLRLFSEKISYSFVTTFVENLQTQVGRQCYATL